MRTQIFANLLDNVQIVLQTDNAYFAAGDFMAKYELEQIICQSVKSDVHGLPKVTDDTNTT